MNAIENLAVNSIRILSADAIQKANSGHPGLPLGCAAAAYELWAHHMNHNPANPSWANRDRFILSGGHGSMLLYSLLHLFGYGLTKEDLMNFRQLGSLTPGHPEYGHTVGVEATTGPLGAGMGMAVGMAIAEKHLASVFNKENYPVVDHYTFVLGGDGFGNVINAVITIIISIVVTAIATFILGFDDPADEDAATVPAAPSASSQENKVVLSSPIYGQAVPLESVKDDAFASHTLGLGAAVAVGGAVKSVFDAIFDF